MNMVNHHALYSIDLIRNNNIWASTILLQYDKTFLLHLFFYSQDFIHLIIDIMCTCILFQIKGYYNIGYGNQSQNLKERMAEHFNDVKFCIICYKVCQIN